jgi:hypothetical protein
MKDILEQSTLRLRPGWKTALWLFVGLGLVMFIVGLASGQAARTWQAFLINTVFWGGLAQAGVMLSVIWQVTDAKWGRAYKRIAEGFGAFLPFAFIAFVLILFGAKYLYEWVHHPMHVKAGWLNLPFFATREIVALTVLFGFSWLYIRNAVKPDLALAQKLIPGWGGAYASRLLANYGDHETEVVRHEARARRMAPALGILYAFVISLVAFDYVMSLDQEWYSTLFGVFFFVGGLYSALALMLILAAATRNKPGLAQYMTINRSNDLGKLTFAIAMLYTYMAFTQYLVIWYSNLQEEVPFLVIRTADSSTPWYPIFWTLFVVLFIFPFLSLMPKTVCRIPPLAAAIGGILFLGQWWAHYLLIVPSVQLSHGGEYHFMFGAYEILLTLGFGGAFFLAFFSFMGKVPVLPISDKHLCKTWHGH